MSLIAFIPARGGSKRLVNKNLLPIDGVPLVVKAIEFCRLFTHEVYVSSDSSAILDIAEQHGAKGMRRIFDYDDDSTVDQVVTHLGDTPHDVLVYQPTVVGVTVTDIKSMMNSGDRATALAVGAHGIWSSLTSQIDERLNSQQPSSVYQEVGVRYYPHGTITDGAPHRILPLNHPVIDIDTPEDYLAARAFGARRHIVFRYVYDTRHGSGHYRRALAIAERLQHHYISFHHVDKFNSGSTGPPDVPFGRYDAMAIDLIINDTLDTSTKEMAELRQNAPVIAFEDLGTGARLADIVINDLYPAHATSHLSYSGHRYSVLRPEFMVGHPLPIADRDGILVTFGGTDPNRLTERVYQVLGLDRNITYVHPPGWLGERLHFAHDVNLARALADSRLVITSGGRTVYEAAAMGTPAFVLAQNPREASHTHLGMEHGNHFLGLHSLVTDDEIRNITKINTTTLQEMSERAYAVMDRRGIDRVVNLIERLLLEES